MTPAPPAPAAGRVLKVGPDKPLKTPSAAAAVAQDGDTIEIDAGRYEGDVAVWSANRLVLRGVGGMAHLVADGRHALGQGIWVFVGDEITAENIRFSGAKVPHHNGAGIKLLGHGATIRSCHFHDNENGILGGRHSDRPILVEHSVFERNGYGDGLTHNIYISSAVSFTLRYSYSHGARVGHLVKSRAYRNEILYNRLMDHDEGTSSYVINIPDGGEAYVVGNELQQGPAAENRIVISYGEESSDRERQALYVINNTIYNRVLDATVVRNATTVEGVVANNLVGGAPALLLDGPGTTLTNVRTPGPWLVDARGADYRLTPEAPAIDAGTPVADIAGFGLSVDAQYSHPALGTRREPVWRIDVGAHEFCGF